MRYLMPSAVALAILCPAAVSAQSSSLFGSRGVNSQGGMTSTPSLGGPSGAGAGNSGTISSASSLTSGGLTGSGTAGAGTGQAGGASAGGAPALGATSGQTLLDATTIGTGAFVGRSDTAGRFVGNSRTGQTNALSAFSQALQGMPNLGGRNGNSRGSQQPAPERFQLRPTLRVGFDYTPRTATASVTSPRFEKRLASITERRPQLAGIDIASAPEGRVVLRGTVATEDSKNLAAALLRLEPGVRQVVNEITVEPPAAP